MTLYQQYMAEYLAEMRREQDQKRLTLPEREMLAGMKHFSETAFFGTPAVPHKVGGY